MVNNLVESGVVDGLHPSVEFTHGKPNPVGSAWLCKAIFPGFL
jgi:hypothetical protein